MSVEIYTFEDADGNSFTDWETQDMGEARAFAQEHQLRLIANTYEWSDSEMIEDYTETEDDEDEDEDDAYDGIDPPLIVETDDGQGNS